MLSHSLVERCRHLCTKLISGWEPPVQLDKIRDDISNIQRDYSFIHYPANRLSDAYLELFKRACTATENSLMRHDRWVPAAVRQCLNDAEELLRVFS